MFILDEPFASGILIDTLVKNKFPVLENDFVKNLGVDGLHVLSDERFIDRFRQKPLIYTSSENAISWINSNLMFSDLVERIDMFKNKGKFRDLLSGMYPDFYYREVKFSHIEKLKSSELQFPFIIKPSVGFFSLGVYYIENAEHWREMRPKIIEETEKVRDYYPDDVLDSDGFIIEQLIEGDEYAVDGYYNSAGEHVIMNILKHSFAGKDDVSDRVYTTSIETIKEVKPEIDKFLTSLGRLAVVKNFPFHLEIRIDKNGKMIPIEMNPMRFAGWCCTDISNYAYRLNTYECFMNSCEPDWELIEEECDGAVYAMVVLEKGAHIKDEGLKGFDYDKLMSKFDCVLEMRRTDYEKYGVFGFMFLRTDGEDSEELQYILNSDLTEFTIY